MKRSLSCLVGLAAATAVLAACGAPAGTGSSSEGPAAISFTNSSTSVGVLAVLVAQSRGLFAKHDVQVTIAAAPSANIAAMLSAGETDLIYASAGSAAGMALKGREIVTVYGASAYSRANELWSAKVQRLEDGRGKGACRIATSPPGAAQFGYATYWNERHGLGCEVTVVPAIDLIASGVTTGSYDYGVVPRGTIGTVPDGVHVLIADGDAEGADKEDYDQEFQLPGAANGMIAGLLGLPENLQGKREAMVRFSRALVEAGAVIDEATPAELAQDVRTIELFKAIPVEQLQAQITALRPGTWRDPVSGVRGLLTEQTWSSSLRSYSYWGIEGFDPESPVLAYDRMVDMSFMDAARAG